eukprot:3940417-Rhodomonas_salina.2
MTTATSATSELDSDPPEVPHPRAGRGPVVGTIHAPAQAHDRGQVTGEGRVHCRNAAISTKGVLESHFRADQRLPDRGRHTQGRQRSAGYPALEKGAQGRPAKPQAGMPDARHYENGDHCNHG